MITEQDLKEAIAECEGTRNPSASTCIKLAAFYTILEHLYGEEKTDYTGYAFSSSPDEIKYSDSEFAQIVKDVGISRSFGVIDEAIQTIEVLNPRLYRSIINKLHNL